MGFSHFPKTCTVGRRIGDSKLLIGVNKSVNVGTVHGPILGVFPPHSQCSQNSLRIHHDVGLHFTEYVSFDTVINLECVLATKAEA